MLEPITKKVTDESDEKGFRFTFYCDICGSPWHSVHYSGSPWHSVHYSGGADAGERESEHVAAYERANQEAIKHFNRCPVCQRVVCDKCFPELEVCVECATVRQR